MLLFLQILLESKMLKGAPPSYTLCLIYYSTQPQPPKGRKHPFQPVDGTLELLKQMLKCQKQGSQNGARQEMLNKQHAHWKRVVQGSGPNNFFLWSYPLHCRMFSSIPGLYLLDAYSTPLPQVVTIKNTFRHRQISQGAKLFQFRTTEKAKAMQTNRRSIIMHSKG